MSWEKDKYTETRGFDGNISVFSRTNGLVLSILAIAVAFLMIYIATNKSIYLIFIIILPVSVLVYAKPIIGLELFFFWLIVMGFVQPVGRQVFGNNLQVIDLMALLALPAVIKALVSARETKDRVGRKPITFIYAYTLLAIIMGIIYANGFEWIATDVRYFIFPIFLYFWSSIVMQDKKDLKQITVVMLIAVAIMGMKSLIIEFSGFSHLFFGSSNAKGIANLDIWRVTLSGGDKYFVLLLPVAAALVFSNIRKYKYLAIIVLSFIVLGLLFSFTRSAWVAAFFGFLFPILYSLKNLTAKKVLDSFILLSLIAFILIIFLSLGIGGRGTFGEAAKLRLQSLYENRIEEDPNITARVEESKVLISSLGPNIFFGKGIGATYEFFLSDEIPLQTANSHNGWFWLILKAGIVGLILVLVAIYLATKDIVKYGLTNEDNILQLISAGYLGAMISFAVMGFSINSIASYEGAVFLGLYFGVARNIRQISEKSMKDELSMSP